MARNDLHRCGRTLIRKTSLLHKIDPTARRSSFADMSIPSDFSHDRLASTGNAWSSAPPATLQSRATLGSISSSRCQITGAPLDKAESALIEFLTNELFAVGSRLVEPDGIEPTTSCLQSRRSPN